MQFIGDFFALGIVIVLSMFYFSKKYYLTLASKLYAICLVLNAVTIVTDIVASYLLEMDGIPIYVNLHLNNFYFFILIFTTGAFVLYLVSKILQHVYDDYCMRRATIALLLSIIVFTSIIVSNIFTGWLFYFDDAGNYVRGPLNSFGYLVFVVQLVFLFICYFRHRTVVGQTMKRAIIQSAIVVSFCIAVRLIHKDIMINGFAMSLFLLVIYLNFQGQRQGINTLTKLNDRVVFYKDIGIRIAVKQKFQVLTIKIRNFDSINHQYSYKIGDEVLFRLAFNLDKLIKSAAVFHMSGTTFAMVVPYSTLEDTKNNLSKLRAYLNGGVECINIRFPLQYGIVDYVADENEHSTDELYEKIEYALFYVEENELDYHLFVKEDVERMQRESYISKRLEAIDEHHGYEVWFQPTYCMADGKFCSAEALLRLRESDGSYVSPAELIPAAEKYGLVNKITWFVLDRVTDFLMRHPELSFLNVSVNMPMSQLIEEDMLDRLNDMCDERGIDRSRIIFEFTERTMPSDFELLRKTMTDFRSLGYRFFLDDFGTGYSNFSSLIKLPFDSVKLDSSLCQKVENHGATYRIVSALNTLFHQMNLAVVAEGIETEKQMQSLKELGVDRVQGYYFAKPMSMEKTVEFYQDKLPD